MVETMIKLIIATVLCYALAAILDSERDTTQYKPFKAWSQGKWWLGQNYLIRELLTKPEKQWWDKIALWLLQYPFSFIINGWHLCKSTTIVLLMLPLAILNPYFDWFWFVIASYVFYGFVFNVSYDY